MDGVMLVNYHTWTWYGVTVRSRLIESFGFVGMDDTSYIPDPGHFKARIAPKLNGCKELKSKVHRFAAIGRPFNGDFCEEYTPSHRHITSCPYCSRQFIENVVDEYHLRVLRSNETNRAGMKKRRAEHGHERTKTGPTKYRETEKFKYAFAVSPDDAD
jgi:hypothetical protein